MAYRIILENGYNQSEQVLLTCLIFEETSRKEKLYISLLDLRVNSKPDIFNYCNKFGTKKRKKIWKKKLDFWSFIREFNISPLALPEDYYINYRNNYYGNHRRHIIFSTENYDIFKFQSEVLLNDMQIYLYSEASNRIENIKHYQLPKLFDQLKPEKPKKDFNLWKWIKKKLGTK